jgi:AcrR family transcriptional regulator
MNDNIKNTKQRIAALAKDKFSRQGYSGVKTSDLAEELGISKRTLYQHFSSKRELFDYVVDCEFDHVKSEMQAMRTRLEDYESLDFIGELSRLWKRMTESSTTFTKEFHSDLKKNLPETYERIHQFRREQIQNNFKKIHEIGVKKGYIKGHINQHILYQMHKICIEELLNPENMEKLPCTVREVMSSIFEVLLFGALTRKGKLEFDEKLDNAGSQN